MNTILTELLPRKLRLWLYVIVFLALLILAAVEANGGDYVAAITSVLASLAPLLAASNINPPADDTPPPPGYTAKHARS